MHATYEQCICADIERRNDGGAGQLRPIRRDEGCSQRLFERMGPVADRGGLDPTLRLSMAVVHAEDELHVVLSLDLHRDYQHNAGSILLFHA